MTAYACVPDCDGLRLWNTRTKHQISVPICPNGDIRGPVSCIRWFCSPDDPREILAFGTALGYLVLWRRSSEEVATPFE